MEQSEGGMSLRKPIRKMRGSQFVAIVGGSGAGKTWLATRLQKILGKKASRICADSFYRDRSHLSARQRTKLNFDHPRAIDTEALSRVIDRLGKGKPAG